MGLAFKAFKFYQVNVSRAMISAYDALSDAALVTSEILSVFSESFSQSTGIAEEVVVDYDENVNSFADHFRYTFDQYAKIFGLINLAINDGSLDSFTAERLAELLDERDEAQSVNFYRDGYSHTEFELAEDVQPIKGWSEV